MGQNLSLQIFQFVNDIHITLGSGVLGVLILVRNGMHTHIAKTIFLSSLCAACVRFIITTPKNSGISPKKVVFITGCDSGLGFSLAQHACEMGFSVFAACLNIKSDGAMELHKYCNNKQLNLIELDITKQESVENAIVQVEKYLALNTESTIWALVNNAGVMVFGEFEWQTENLIRQQLDVNLFGTMRITKAFSPLLRKYKGRIITVSSHCANETLPGLSVYGATKAGLSAWSDGLRVELNKYGVNVIIFIPGSFVQQSNIMSRIEENIFEMQSAMTEEQNEFYGDYFEQYNSYLSVLSRVKPPKKIMDERLYEIYEKTLLETRPERCYVHEPWKYTIYHTLCKFSPFRIRDYLIIKFVQMPQWEREKRVNSIANVIG